MTTPSTPSSPSSSSPSDDLYQSLVLDHARAPRNAGALPGATHVARGDNPFCGDRVTVSLIVAGDRIADVRFEGTGCAISTASASMMTAAARGRSRAEVESLCQRFEGLLAGSAEHVDVDVDVDVDGVGNVPLGELHAFEGVRRFPVRVKCARLPWRTMMAALAGAGEAVSTE